MSGVKYDLPKCLEKAIQVGITDPTHWSLIHSLLAHFQISVTVDGVEYNKLNCPCAVLVELEKEPKPE